MPIYDRYDRHAGLVHRMADTLGVDLAEEAMRGRVREGELRSAVYRCMGCTEAGACDHWLDDHADGAGAAPDYCRNKSVLDALAKT